MPRVLRKRKAPEAPAPAPAPKKAGSKPAKAAATKAKAAAVGKKNKGSDAVKKAEPPKEDKKAAEETEEEEKEEPKKKTATKSGKLEVGDEVDIEGFGGEIETNDGDKTSLKQLLEKSEAGVVLFTYPKASTPGCTKQVCFFRDAYKPLTAGGLAIYGLSTDSPKANTTFKEKQNLPYPLLCDQKQTLIEAIGLKKAPKGTTRGVFVISKEGKVLVAEAGSPQGTLDRVQKLVDELKK